MFNTFQVHITLQHLIIVEEKKRGTSNSFSVSVVPFAPISLLFCSERPHLFFYPFLSLSLFPYFAAAASWSLWAPRCI